MFLYGKFCYCFQVKTIYFSAKYCGCNCTPCTPLSLLPTALQLCRAGNLISTLMQSSICGVQSL